MTNITWANDGTVEVETRQKTQCTAHMANNGRVKVTLIRNCMVKGEQTLNALGKGELYARGEILRRGIATVKIGNAYKCVRGIVTEKLNPDYTVRSRIFTVLF
jgi:hypothetical protein